MKSSIDRIENSLDKLKERYSGLSNKIIKAKETVAQDYKRITEHLSVISKNGVH